MAANPTILGSPQTDPIMEATLKTASAQQNPQDLIAQYIELQKQAKEARDQELAAELARRLEVARPNISLTPAAALLQSTYGAQSAPLVTATQEYAKAAEADQNAIDAIAGQALKGGGGMGMSGSPTGLIPTAVRAKNQAERLAREDKRIAQAQNRIDQKQADVFDKDTVMNNLVSQSNRIDNGMHTLDSPLVTYQMFNEVQADINAAISKGASNAVSQEEKRNFETYKMDLANLKQKFTGKPEDIASPEAVQYLRDIMGRLQGAYGRNMAQRSDLLRAGRGGSSVLTQKKAAYTTPPTDMGDHNQNKPAPSAGDAIRAQFGLKKK